MKALSYGLMLSENQKRLVLPQYIIWRDCHIHIAIFLDGHDVYAEFLADLKLLYLQSDPFSRYLYLEDGMVVVDLYIIENLA